MLRLRVASAAVLIPVLLAVVLLGGPWLVALVALIALLAGWETADLLHGAGLPVPRLVVALLAAGVTLLVGLAPGDPRAWAAVVAATVLVPGFAALAVTEPRQGFLTWAGAVFAIVYVGSLSSVLRILDDGLPIADRATLDGLLDDGRVWLLVLVLGVWAYDTSAYAAGRAHGRGRFMVHISPSKTWSGVVGGLVGCVVVSALLVAATGQHPLAGVVVGLAVAVTAQAGDLVESLLKRAAGAKDSGRLIPGHGGVLDRVDSFLFAAPVFHLLLVALPIWGTAGG